MELIEAEDKDEGALPEPEPRYKAEPPEPDEDSEDDYERPRWLLPLIAAIIAAAVVVGLVFLARWIYHEVHHHAPAVSSNTNKQTANGPSGQSGASGAGGSGSSNNSASSGSKTGSSSNKQLTNTGPGNVAGIFIGASLAAAGLHFIISVRRSSAS